jgi:hypothetical protein
MEALLRTVEETNNTFYLVWAAALSGHVPGDRRPAPADFAERESPN